MRLSNHEESICLQPVEEPRFPCPLNQTQSGRGAPRPYPIIESLNTFALTANLNNLFINRKLNFSHNFGSLEVVEQERQAD